LFQADLNTKEDALANADSATNLLWLINNGPESQGAKDEAPAPATEQPAGPSFTEFTLDS
jgi:twitching motility protein PilU